MSPSSAQSSSSLRRSSRKTAHPGFFSVEQGVQAIFESTHGRRRAKIHTVDDDGGNDNDNDDDDDNDCATTLNFSLISDNSNTPQTPVNNPISSISMSSSPNNPTSKRTSPPKEVQSTKTNASSTSTTATATAIATPKSKSSRPKAQPKRQSKTPPRKKLKKVVMDVSYVVTPKIKSKPQSKTPPEKNLKKEKIDLSVGGATKSRDKDDEVAIHNSRSDVQLGISEKETQEDKINQSNTEAKEDTDCTHMEKEKAKFSPPPPPPPPPSSITSQATPAKTPTPKRKRELKKGDSDRYGPEKDRTCPWCKKVFAINTGCAYHIEHKVCLQQPEQPNQTPQRRRRGKTKVLVGTAPFPKLTPGSKFVTPYGVVQVTTDDRAPSDLGQTKLSSDYKEEAYKWRRKRDRIQNRKDKMQRYSAKKQRQRRDKLLQLYFQQNRNQGEATMNQGDVWKLYCNLKNASLRNILLGLYSRKRDEKMRRPLIVEDHPWLNVGDDPMVPRDSYPDRIVECVLIADERYRVYDVDPSQDFEGRVSRVNVATRIVEKATAPTIHAEMTGGKQMKVVVKVNGEKIDFPRDIERNKNSKNYNSGDDDTGKLHLSGLKLYLKRSLLTMPYSPVLPLYICKHCGQNFDSRMGFKSHVTHNVCSRRVEQHLKERMEKLEDVEDSITKKIEPPSPLIVPIRMLPGQKRLPKERKNKKFPAWMRFYPDLSPWYPEIFNIIGFRRGSNNKNFMQKKWEAIGPGRKKVRKSRARVLSPESQVLKDAGVAWIDYPTKPVYPQAWKLLYFRTPSDTKTITCKRPISTNNGKSKRTYSEAFSDESAKDNKEIDLHHLPSDGEETFIESKNKSTAQIDKVTPSQPQMQASSASSVPLSMGSVTPTANCTTPSKEKENEDKGEVNKSSEKEKGEIESCVLPPKKKKKKRAKAPLANPRPPGPPIIVDISVLVEEVRAGRYPSIKPYDGDHTDICILCKDGGLIFCCEFCGNAEHLHCVKSKVTIRDPEPDDDFMCHRCIQTILARRLRAEKRRLQKRNETLGISTPSDKTSGDAEGGDVIAFSPAASGTPVLTSPGPYIPGITPLNPAVQAAASLKREVTWNQSEFDSHEISYSQCPIGGPGGLICCGPCTASYSRLLVETAKEMEIQTISNIGHEVSELMELLRDAQIRLQQTVDVEKGNGIRRSLLERNEIEAPPTLSENDAEEEKVDAMGIVDILNQNQSLN